MRDNQPALAYRMQSGVRRAESSRCAGRGQGGGGNGGKTSSTAGTSAANDDWAEPIASDTAAAAAATAASVSSSLCVGAPVATVGGLPTYPGGAIGGAFHVHGAMTCVGAPVVAIGGS